MCLCFLLVHLFGQNCNNQKEEILFLSLFLCNYGALYINVFDADWQCCVIQLVQYPCVQTLQMVHNIMSLPTVTQAVK